MTNTKTFVQVTGKYFRTSGAKSASTTVYGNVTEAKIIEEGVRHFKAMNPKSTPVQLSYRNEDAENPTEVTL